MKRKFGYGFFIPIAAGAVALGLLLRPETALAAAREGLERFALIILPSLLPFFICADLLLRSGALHAAGRLLKKPMRALFGLGGEGGAVYMIGAVSGYPTGARLAGELYRESKLNLAEMERMCLLSNLCGPLFITGAVATGILASPQAAAPMLIAQHAGAWLVTAVYARIFPSNPYHGYASGVSEPRLPAGVLIGGSCYDAMLAMLKICAIMTLFTVLLRLCEAIGILGALTGLFSGALGALDLPAELGRSLSVGLFEMSAACAETARLGASLQDQSALCSALAAFGGLSVVLQTLAFAPVRAGRFILAKLAHAILAALFTFLLFPIFCADAPAFAIQQTNPAWQTELSAVLGLLLASAVAVGAVALISNLLKIRRSKP